MIYSSHIASRVGGESWSFPNLGERSIMEAASGISCPASGPADQQKLGPAGRGPGWVVD